MRFLMNCSNTEVRSYLIGIKYYDSTNKEYQKKSRMETSTERLVFIKLTPLDSLYSSICFALIYSKSDEARG
jgi:hypothetical protein